MSDRNDPRVDPAALPDGQTHFGFETVPEDAKAERVAGVFHSVAQKYDVMNDVMSAGLHRVWKAFTIGRVGVRPGMRVLDIAGSRVEPATSRRRWRSGPARPARSG